MMSTVGKLNRSHSESELYKLNLENLCIQDCGTPSFRRNVPSLVKKTIVIVEEIYHNSPVMSRYGQSVPNHLHNIENIPSSPSVLNSSLTVNNANARLDSQEHQKQKKLNYDDCDETVPMDVDSSCNKTKSEECLSIVEKMDVDSYYDDYRKQRLNHLDGILKKRNFKTGTTVLITEKEFLKNNSQINPILCEKKKFRCNSLFLVILFSLILLCLGLWHFHDDIVYVNSDIQLQNIQKDLLEQVYDQKGPVNIVIRSLELRSHWSSKIKVLGFIGSSGVGKTFMANILKKHFYPGLVHELYGTQLNFKDQWEQILNRLKSCCLNLIIVDDLNQKDVTTLFELVLSLPKNQYILVVSIFSIQYSDDHLNYFINYDDINEIRYEFDNSNLFHELAVFNQFSMSQVKDWLEKQLKVQNKAHSEKLLDNVLHNHNALYEGLKGLYSKLLMELEGKN